MDFLQWVSYPVGYFRFSTWVCPKKLIDASAVEGIVTTVFGIFCFFFLPNTPADAKFLTEEERMLAMARLKLDSHGATDVEDVNEEKFDWRWVKMAFKAPQTWLSSLIWFFVLIPLYVHLPLQGVGATCRIK